MLPLYVCEHLYTMWGVSRYLDAWCWGGGGGGSSYSLSNVGYLTGNAVFIAIILSVEHFKA